MDYFSNFFGGGTPPPPPPPTTFFDGLMDNGKTVMNGFGNAGMAVWNGFGSVGDFVLSGGPGNLFSGTTSVIGNISNLAFEALALGVQKSGGALMYVSDYEKNPVISSVIPAASGGVLLRYAYFKGREAFKDCDWIKIKKREEKKKDDGAAIDKLRFVKNDQNQLTLEFTEAKKSSNEYRIGIPFSKDDWVFQKDKISKTATGVLKGSTAFIFGASCELGALSRVLGFDLNGLSGLFAKGVAATPNLAVWSTGQILELTDKPAVKVAASAALSIGAFYSWSSINLSGAKDGWFDWEKEGWERVDFKSVAKDVGKLAMGLGLLASSGYLITNI